MTYLKKYVYSVCDYVYPLKLIIAVTLTLVEKIQFARKNYNGTGIPIHLFHLLHSAYHCTVPY